MRHALIADARTDRELDLWDRFFAALHQQRKISFIMVGVENDLLSAPELGSRLRIQT